MHSSNVKRAAVVLLAAAAFAFWQTGVAAEPPRLVPQITVDQLCGDLPTRYYERLGEGGFRYLWEQGVVYRNARHVHANSETIVGQPGHKGALRVGR